MESVTRFWSYEAQNIRCVREADFDRVSAENLALQQRLTVQDQRADDLETELKITKQALNSLKGERDDMCAGKVQCQFPQSCTTRCDCDIPDFTPGNGNRARRRAAAIETPPTDYFKCMKGE